MVLFATDCYILFLLTRVIPLPLITYNISTLRKYIKKYISLRMIHARNRLLEFLRKPLRRWLGLYVLFCGIQVYQRTFKSTIYKVLTILAEKIEQKPLQNSLVLSRNFWTNYLNKLEPVVLIQLRQRRYTWSELNINKHRWKTFLKPLVL